jgi:ligand-binding sensor domain-containing protein
MKPLFFLSILCLPFIGNTQNKLGGIGQWRGHYDNHSVQQVVKGDVLYAASPYQIIGIDANMHKTWIDKTTGLHESTIQQLTWDPILNQLIIGYTNSNIDILKGDQVFNLNAIQLTNLYPDKKINSIQVKQNWAFVATNFGIVIIDLLKHEIKDTWYPNNNQQAVPTYNIAIVKDSIYAITENGLWCSPYQNNWILPNAWKNQTSYNAYGLKNIVVQNDKLNAYNQHEVYQIPSTTPIASFTNATILKIDSSTKGLNISIQYASKKGAIVNLSNNGTVSTLVDSTQLISPLETVLTGTQLWIADSSQGLLLVDKQKEWIPLGGPKATITGLMSTNANQLIAPYGNTNSGYAVLNEDGWTHFSQISNSNLPIINASGISKLDDSYWLSTNTGILHVFNDSNKLAYFIPNQQKGTYQSIQLDQNNAVWALQDQQGIVRQVNNNWSSIPLPNNLFNNGLSKFALNHQGQAWVIAPNNQGIYVYQSKDIFTTETWKQLTTQSTNGNLPSMHVTSIATDLAGSIWVGTDNGIGILNCGDVTNSPCNAYLPIVSNNGFNGYLFQREIVHCIAVDGANKKWIGTNNGAWLLSEDGLEMIAHFTKENSPLPTDTVLQISIVPASGEVFFNTTNQLVSYRGTATEGKQTQSKIQIFPNPIPPSYNGTVAIRGLIENALVKITDLTGKLLFQTQALGGQAIWNGRTYEGKKVATGIYLVFVRDLAGNENSVGKIVIADGY